MPLPGGEVPIEYVGKVGGIDTTPGVLDLEFHAAVSLSDPNRDRTGRWGKPKSVLHQIIGDLGNPIGVGVDRARGLGLDLEIEIQLLGSPRKAADDLENMSPEVHRLKPEIELWLLKSS